MTNLPDPPWRVLGRRRNGFGDDRHGWFTASSDGKEFWSIEHEATIDAKLITPIDHPRNDPEALEIIRKAKEAT